MICYGSGAWWTNPGTFYAERSHASGAHAQAFPSARASLDMLISFSKLIPLGHIWTIFGENGEEGQVEIAEITYLIYCYNLRDSKGICNIFIFLHFKRVHLRSTFVHEKVDR